jgi:hypothetical protein
MSKWTPCKRRVFIKKFQALGFDPPEQGAKHAYMRYGTFTLTLPSNDEYTVPQLKMLLKVIEAALGRKFPGKSGTVFKSYCQRYDPTSH